MHTGENPGLRARKSWIVEEDPWFFRTWFAVSDLGLPGSARLFGLAFWKRKHAPADYKVKGVDNPSLDPDPNHGETMHSGLRCDHYK